MEGFEIVEDPFKTDKDSQDSEGFVAIPPREND
jgi:hypothetical protein